MKLFCPNCGNDFDHLIKNEGKVTGGLGGILAGAYFGAQVGIAMGPLGAIAGTVPGAVLGGIFGKNLGNNYDKPKCPKCSTSFKIDNFKFFTSKEENLILPDLLNQSWNEDISRELKEILEIHIIFDRMKIDYDFSSSIHHQFKTKFGSDYKFQNKTDYSALISLTKLNLRTSYDIEDITFIQYLRNLRGLSLYSDSSNIQGINFIENLINLEFIHLYAPKIADLGFLRNGRNLRNLTLITAEPNNYNFLLGLEKLEHLSFSPSYLDPNHPVFNLKKLISLDLFNCNSVADENSFIRLTNLKHLKAHFFKIKNIEFLKELKLIELKASKANLRDDQVEWINQNVKKVLLL